MSERKGFFGRAAARRKAISEGGTGSTGFTAADSVKRGTASRQASVDARADRMEGNSERMAARRAAAPAATSSAAPSAKPVAPSAKPVAPSAKPVAPSAKPKPKPKSDDMKAWAKGESDALWASKERAKLQASKKQMAARNNTSALSKAAAFVKKAPTVKGHDSYKQLMDF